MNYHLSILALASIVLAMNSPDSAGYSKDLPQFEEISHITEESFDLIRSNGIKEESVEFALPSQESRISPASIAIAKCAQICNDNTSCQSFYVAKSFKIYKNAAPSTEGWARCKLFDSEIALGLIILPEQGARMFNLNRSSDSVKSPSKNLPKNPTRHVRGAALNSVVKLISFTENMFPAKKPIAHKRTQAFVGTAAPAAA
ncbi:hypothetical protein NEOLI_004773 [Neolecta irregularis DAH-3]|uniref:Apple domain-containing protein n=1 Tax=Neolecta irregularis (strain DAH-3) TaxID=1198029 RepID=A0A1U7LL72_NEOID|nr:hypothetical protein NEOLI_004773 [Neolecta irregularis DAH-3]|eukprot:OLL23292.1 hypothetical protein NEOLI_004773 [Neolecta irregularis DAH-3]